MADRIIRATHDDTTVRVYQAYNNEIADVALEAQSFKKALQLGLWSSKRMTWIKPSKVWMAYRCGWTTLKNDSNQARVLALDLDRTKFNDIILANARLHHTTGEKVVKKEKKYRDCAIVVQWDPERVMNTKQTSDQTFTKPLKLVRSIQIGLRPPANEILLDPGVVKKITDVTQDFKNALGALQDGSLDDAEALLWPGDGQEETVLELPADIESHLNINRVVSPSRKRDAVVVLGCTANPPHQGHLYCLQAARFKANELGFNVLFTTIAIAPFGYLHHKMLKKEQGHNQFLLLDDSMRFQILKLTATHMHAKEQFGFHMPTRTYGSALECGRATRPNDDTHVIVVVGSDRFNWKKKCHPDLITLCCARSEEQLAKIQAEMQEDILNNELAISDQSKWQLMSSDAGPPTSSTAIRTILKETDRALEEKREDLLEQGYPDEAARLLILQAVGSK